MPQSLLEHLFLHWDYPAEYSITISPHGIYAYVPLTQYFSIFGIHPTYPGETSWRGKVVRLADNAVLPVIFTKEMKNSPEPGKWRWVTDNIATVRIPLTNDKMIYHMDNGKQIRTSAQFVGIPSPNGRFAVCIQVNSDKPNDKVVYLKLCNLDNGHTLQIALPINHPDQWKWCYWWVSNDTVGYYTHQGGYNRIHSDPHSWLPVSHEEVHYLHLPIF
jgi:hypothetical protein